MVLRNIFCRGLTFESGAQISSRQWTYLVNLDHSENTFPHFPVLRRLHSGRGFLGVTAVLSRLLLIIAS